MSTRSCFHQPPPPPMPVLRLAVLALVLALAAGAISGERRIGSAANPPLLADQPLPPVSETPFGEEPGTEGGEVVLPAMAGVEDYRRSLEERLLERYNNLPEFAGQVARVVATLARPIKTSLDGSLIQAEFDQLVFDRWGGRIPALEKEYFVVTFGSGGAAEVRTDPGVRVGLDLEKTYSELVPLASDPFRRVRRGPEFKDGDNAKMPNWWRPSFRDPE